MVMSCYRWWWWWCGRGKWWYRRRKNYPHVDNAHKQFTDPGRSVPLEENWIMDLNNLRGSGDERRREFILFIDLSLLFICTFLCAFTTHLDCLLSVCTRPFSSTHHLPATAFFLYLAITVSLCSPLMRSHSPSRGLPPLWFVMMLTLVYLRWVDLWTRTIYSYVLICSYGAI